MDRELLLGVNPNILINKQLHGVKKPQQIIRSILKKWLKSTCLIAGNIF